MFKKKKQEKWFDWHNWKASKSLGMMSSRIILRTSMVLTFMIIDIYTQSKHVKIPLFLLISYLHSIHRLDENCP